MEDTVRPDKASVHGLLYAGSGVILPACHRWGASSGMLGSHGRSSYSLHSLPVGSMWLLLDL